MKLWTFILVWGGMLLMGIAFWVGVVFAVRGLG